MQTPHIMRHGLYGEDAAAIRPEFIHLEPISVRSGQHGWTISPHTHPGILQLLLISAGGGTLATEAVEARLETGALIILPSGSVHAFRFDPGTEGWVLSVAADLLSDPRLLGVSAEWLRASGPRWTNPGAEHAHGARLGWLLADLAGVLVRSEQGLTQASLIAQVGLILSLADDLLADAGTGGPSKDGSALAHRFRALVEDRFREDWSVARYAAALGASTPTLTRACRAAAEKPPGEWVQDRRLLEAMRALTYTSAPVTSIAASLGFSDSAYFARFFKRRTGMTASAFRREGGWFRG